MSILMKYKETKKHELTNSCNSPTRDYVYILVKEPDSPGNIFIKSYNPKYENNDSSIYNTNPNHIPIQHNERICDCV